jgi:cell division protein FtsB
MIRDYTKVAIAAALLAFFVFAVVQMVKFSIRMRAAQADYEVVEKEYNHTRAEQERLREEFTYFSNPTNLSKELRARFNYTLPGEKVLILVPENRGSTED